MIISEYGYIGVSKKEKSNHLGSKYLGAFFLSSKVYETEFLTGFSAENSVSFFLSILDGKLASNCVGVSALFDMERKELTLTRELFGRVPLYYTITDGFTFQFSTSYTSLLAQSTVRRDSTPDVRRIRSYATVHGDVKSTCDSDTFLSNIKSVLPGHALKLTIDSATSIPLLRFKPSKWSHLSSLEDFGEEFRRSFLNAVRTSDKGPNQRLSSHLSGGMDSSSVSAALRYLYPDQPLLTLYNISNTLKTNENLYARAVAEAIGSEHHELIQFSNDLELLTEYIRLSGQPSNTFSSPSSSWTLMKFAQDHHYDTIFNGIGGDSVVGTGFEATERAFADGNWSLVRQLLEKRVRYFSHSHQYPKWDQLSFDQRADIVVQNFLYKQLTNKLMWSSVADFWRFFQTVSRSLPISYTYFLRRGFQSLINKARRNETRQTMSVLTEDILQRPGCNDAAVMGLLDGSAEQPALHYSFRGVFNRLTLLSNEQDFALANHMGMVSTSPFYNHELFELCLAVPDVVKFGDGIGRAHFREGMKGLLVDKVRCRSTKTPLRSHGQDVVIRIFGEAKSLLFDSKTIWEYIDRQKFDHQLAILTNENIPYNQKVGTRFHISRTISLAIWFRDIIQAD
ncbi:MAG: lasso peptide isopeptide bond-forming cyclase [Dyadobacter fermentans]